ncbi:SPRY-domain-containing protein, partial [Jaminaea rosea]
NVLAVLVPLLVLLSTLLLLLLLFLIMLIIVRRRARIALASGDGPLDIGREEELEGAGGLEGVEERWLSTQDEATRSGYARAKDWLLSHPPGSVASEITISQFLSIQEKGVSAWSFEPDYESNSSCFVEARTEITFVADGEGMSPREGGGCSVQSNLPLPKVNDVYYWEAKMFSKPASTNISLGLATKPYPSFRLPGWSKHSVGFFSQDGFKCHNYPFAAQSYGPSYVQGDVIGVGYRPRTGTVFYTRNGKKLEDAFIGLQRYNVFPTIGADGPAEVHVNLGQAGFVFIEANVKKWGLAPMTGTLAPPPAYGQERGSILIEAAGPSARAEGN